MALGPRSAVSSKEIEKERTGVMASERPMIGWIGLGQMGRRMARHVAAAGYPMIVADAAGPAGAPDGARIGGDNAAVGAAAGTVVLSVPDGAASLAVCRDLIGARPRRVELVIDTSTIGMPAAERAYDLLAAAGIAYVDAPVSGGVAGAEAASLSVILGCSHDLLQRVSPLLSCIGGHLFHVGERPGMGQAVKLLNNFLSATAMAATSEAMAFAEAVGLDMQTALDVVNRSTGQNTASRDKFPQRIVTGRYDGGFAAAMMAKDVRLYRDAVGQAESAGTLARAIDTLWSAFDRAEPGADFTRIYPYLRDRRAES
jgi:3-hydroxyisobutyrate dehydrogenase-like beta-hydroxyacid dehydrogenase